MSDYPNIQDDSRGLSIIAGFAIGAVVGAGIALLLAPATGSETRQRLADTARRLSKDAGHTLDKARETVSELGADAKSAIDAGRDAFARDGDKRAAARTTHAATSVPGA